MLQRMFKVNTLVSVFDKEKSYLHKCRDDIYKQVDVNIDLRDFYFNKTIK